MYRAALLCVLSFVLPLSAATAWAQAGYPAKPVRWIVPFPPGGPTDVVARAVGPKLSERLRQPVIIDNRPGAASNIGMEATAKAPPDGYTLAFVVPSMVTNPFLYRMSWDPLKELTAVIQLTSSYYLLLASPSFEPKTVSDILAAAKAKPGAITCALMPALPGLACELFKSLGQVQMTAVPYKGSTPAITDAIGGHINLVFEVINTAGPLVKSGRLRAIGTTTPRRLTALPDLPAIGEQLPGFQLEGWQGVVTASATPREIVYLLNREFAAVLNLPEVRQRITDAGLPVVGGTAEQFGSVIRRDSAVLGKVIREAGIKAE